MEDEYNDIYYINSLFNQNKPETSITERLSREFNETFFYHTKKSSNTVENLR